MTNKRYELKRAAALGPAGDHLASHITQSKALRRTLKANEVGWEKQLRRMMRGREWGFTPSGLWVQSGPDGLVVGAKPPPNMRSAILFSEPLDHEGG